MAIYLANGAVNNNIGVMLGPGNDSNTLMNISNVFNSVVPKNYVSTYTSPSGTIAGGTILYSRTTDYISVDGQTDNINGVASKDFTLTANTSTPEVHGSQKGRKLAITSIDNHGNITYGATNATSYDLTATTGNVYDRPVDSMRDPYGTPPKLYSLIGLAPTGISYRALTSY